MFNAVEFGTVSFMEKICSLPPLVAKHVYVYFMPPPPSFEQGRWEWTDGTAWDYTHWAAGQPQNWILENCLGRWDLWHDVTCTEPNYAFVCKI